VTRLYRSNEIEFRDHRKQNAFYRISLLFFLLILLPKLALAGEKLNFDRLEFKTGITVLKADGVEIENSSFSADALKTIFSDTALGAQADALSKFDADRIFVKSLRQEQIINGQISASILSNVTLTSIKSGVAASLKVDAGTFGTGDGNDAQAGTIGAITASEIDLGLFIAGGATKAGNKNEYRKAYGEAAFNSISISSPTGPVLTVERASMRDFRIKTSEQGLSGIAERILRRQTQSPMSDADLNAVILDTVDILTSFSIGLVEVSQTVLTDKRSDEISKINRIVYESSSDGKPQHIRMDGFEGLYPLNRVRIGSLEQSGFSFLPVAESVKSFASKPNANFAEADPIAFIPVIGKFEIRDVTIDTSGVPPVHAGLRSMVLAVDNPNGGVPRSAELTFDGLFGPIPSDSNEPAIDNLIALGYRDVNLSGTLRLAIDEKAKMFKTETLLTGENMGTVGATANLINVPVDLLMRNPTAALIAFAGARIKDMSVTIENRGLADRLIDQDAIKTKRSPQDVRKNYAAAASASLQIYLGMSPNAKALTQSLAKFIDKPTRLSITAKAKNPDGVALAEGATAENPAQVLEAFDLMISQN
jgi:hypothetical protein